MEFWKGNFEDGKRLFLAVLRDFPESSIVSCDYANYLLLFERNHVEALKYFEQAVSQKPRKAAHYYNLAKLLFKKEQFSRIDELLGEALVCEDSSSLNDCFEEITLMREKARSRAHLS